MLRSVETSSKTLNSPHCLSVYVEDNLVKFELDTGACKTVMSSRQFEKLFHKPLIKVSFKLHAVAGQKIQVLGECNVTVVHNGTKFCLSLTVIDTENDFTPLLGRNWLNELFPEWQNSFKVHLLAKHNDEENMVEVLKSKFSNVFDNILCRPINHFQVTFKTKPNSIPVFKKAYDMPFALKPRVERKIEQMVRAGILRRVRHSEWASPIVIVPKKDGDVRICSDFRSTINKVLNIDQYPLPKPDDIVIFTVLDLSGAYQQLEVSPGHQKLLTINTHMGLFQFTRLTYGIASAPAIFQSVMDQVLCGIDKVSCYLDDILISGSSLDQNVEKVQLVLQRLQFYTIKVNLDKCIFF